MSSERPLDELRAKRDKALRVGFFNLARDFTDRLEQQAGQSENADENAAAALSADADPRLHRTLDDAEEIKERHEKAARNGFPSVADRYSERYEQVTGEALETEDEETNEQADEGDEAALSEEEQTRAALAAPDDGTLAKTEAALGASDVVEAAERGQSPPQYVYDAYGVDPRDYSDEYELRSEIRDATPKRLKQEADEVSDAEAALSVADRNRIADKDVTPEELIRREFDLEPAEFDSADELREAVREAGGFSKENDAAPSRLSAFSDPNDWV